MNHKVTPSRRQSRSVRLFIYFLINVNVVKSSVQASHIAAGAFHKIICKLGQHLTYISNKLYLSQFTGLSVMSFDAIYSSRDVNFLFPLPVSFNVDDKQKLLHNGKAFQIVFFFFFNCHFGACCFLPAMSAHVLEIVTACANGQFCVFTTYASLDLRQT